MSKVSKRYLVVRDSGGGTDKHTDRHTDKHTDRQTHQCHDSAWSKGTKLHKTAPTCTKVVTFLSLPAPDSTLEPPVLTI